MTETGYDTGWIIILTTPKFPMCQNPEKNRVLARTAKKWQSPELATLKLTRVVEWQVLDIVISEGGQLRDLFFSSLDSGT